MRLAYVDEAYYQTEYRAGMKPLIDGPAFGFYTRMATQEIRSMTFGNINENSAIPDAVKMCCCEVAEKLQSFDAAKDSKGMVLQSYSNDGESGTYLVSDWTETGVKAAIYEIIKKWLLDTGLMFCGVKNES